MQRFADLLTRFRRDDRGVFLVIFAILAMVLIATSGAVVDFTKMQQARTRAQTALDSAALALQSQISTQTADQLKVKAQTILTERLNDATITATVISATPTTATGKLNIQAYIQVPTAFVQLVGITSMRSNLQSEVTRSSSDLEVSVSLDITGSMAATYNKYGVKTSDKIGDLITATNSLIDLLVSTTQTPTYSKMAIVPWAAGANMGSTYANNVRGSITGGVTISGITWSAGLSKNITAITRANPGFITVNNVTSLLNGDWVYISGVSGMTQINGKIGYITNLDTANKKFNINVGGTNLCTSSGGSCNYSSWTSGGTVQKCLTNNCEEIITTSSAHGLATSDWAYITGVSGMTNFNDKTWAARNLTTTTFAATGSTPANGVRTSGGTSYCAKYGCQYLYFSNANSGTSLFQANHCVVERTTNAYTDTAPSTTPLSINYRSGGDECVTPAIQPLTSDKTVLHALANSLTAETSTSGHVGLAWGWYMIAPNFSYLWPTASQPAAYGKSNLIKAVVFMTDGEFNTPFCSGVVSKDSLSSNYVGNSDRINCDSPNGTSKAQAQQFCDNIKATSNHILLYTVGFDLAGDNAALTFLTNCASSPDYFYQADDGADLTNAFKSIAQSLSELRISK
jgi:Flp pilus assembly protein TadG